MSPSSKRQREEKAKTEGSPETSSPEEGATPEEKPTETQPSVAKTQASGKPTSEEKPEGEQPGAQPPEGEQTDPGDDNQDPGPPKARYAGAAGPEKRVSLSPKEREALDHAARVEHNARTGGGELRENELQAEREKHDRRTAGIPDPDESSEESSSEEEAATPA